MNDSKSAKLELAISRLLRWGVITSLSIVIFGTILSFVHHPEYLHRARPEQPTEFPHTISEVLTGASQGRGQSIVFLGLFLLIATPVLRVAAAMIGFIWEGDKTYAIITSIVLALLILSFLLGRVE